MSPEKVVRYEVIGREEVWPYLEAIALRYNCSFPRDLFGDYVLVKTEGGKFSQVFITANSALLPNLLNLGLKVEFVGVSILKIKGSKAYPQLNMGNFMVKHCKNKVILPDPLVQKVLYGKEVTVKERFDFTSGILVSRYGEFLGFVRLTTSKRGTRIIPEKEIGWYLRRGG